MKGVRNGAEVIRERDRDCSAGVVLRSTFHQARLAHVGNLAKGLWVMVIRIGTWNLENLFKPPNSFAPNTEQEYHAKLDALASAITRMDPHVLAVQEAASGSRATTASRRALAMAFQAAWMGYSALMWGIEVGCVRSPYEANPGGSPDVENTAQPGFAAYHPCLR